MAHGVNANLARRWVNEAERRRSDTSAEVATRRDESTTFVPLQLPPPVEATVANIRVELRRGATTVSVSWPCAAAAECAAWMRELLR
jgi:transposase